MKSTSWFTLLLALCLTLMIFACSPASPTPNTAVDPTGTTAAAVVTEDVGTTPSGRDPISGALSEAALLQIVRESFASFPWRMQQSVLVKATGQTSTTLTEAQSSTRGYSQSAQIVGDKTVTIESILLDSALYLKMTGSGLAETYGIADGEWVEVPPDSPLAQLSDSGAADPARIGETFAAEFAALKGESGLHELVFQVAGSEDVNGISTTVYEAITATFTYRWWIGADQRLYKMILDAPVATRTLLLEYDPTINIQPPIP